MVELLCEIATGILALLVVWFLIMTLAWSIAFLAGLMIAAVSAV